MIIIENDELIIRQFTLEDLHDLNEMESNPNVMKSTSIKKPLTLEESKVRLENIISEYGKDTGRDKWAVEKNNKVVAWIMIMDTKFDAPEIGIMVNEKFWRKGIGNQTIELILTYAKTKQISKVYALTGSDNIKSQRLLTKHSFIKEKKIKNTTLFSKVI